MSYKTDFKCSTCGKIIKISMTPSVQVSGDVLFFVLYQEEYCGLNCPRNEYRHKVRKIEPTKELSQDTYRKVFDSFLDFEL